jgi:hypothetical protein
MRNYWIAFILIVATGLAGVGMLVFKCFIRKPESETPRIYYLNADSMREAGQNIVDSNKGPGVISIFPAEKQAEDNDSIPLADLYICRSFAKQDSLSGDTAIILLDVATSKYLTKEGDPTQYWTGVKAAKKFKECRVFIPPSLFKSIKRYRYKYATVTLITDDDER